MAAILNSSDDILSAAAALGVKIFYDAEVTDLDVRDGRFESAVFVAQGIERKVRTKAVRYAALVKNAIEKQAEE